MATTKATLLAPLVVSFLLLSCLYSLNHQPHVQLSPTPGVAVSLHLLEDERSKETSNSKQYVDMPQVKVIKDKQFVAYGRKLRFNVSNPDHLLVMLHIQKTGGSFLNRAVTQRLRPPLSCTCRKKRNDFDWKHCKCLRTIKGRNTTWLFSRCSTGWACGVHPDFTQLTECLPKKMNTVEKPPRRNRRFFIFTMLREPVSRFVSEFVHTRRGGTWANSSLVCNGRSPTSEELPRCYGGRNWKTATLHEYVGCRHNLAHNRMTRMLANLSLVGCYNENAMPLEKRHRLLLDSAKTNLRHLAFFGLLEELKKTQTMFERLLSNKFTDSLILRDTKSSSKSMAFFETLTKDELENIHSVVSLDLELYTFAKELFLQRYEKLTKPT